MPDYTIAAKNFHFQHSLVELEPFEIQSKAGKSAYEIDDKHLFTHFVTAINGWVAGARRNVTVFSGKDGYVLDIDGCGEYLIAPHREVINKRYAPGPLSQLDREVLLGPVIVLALALRGTWSLHASAVTYRGNTIAFLAESGTGKSTLAKYLSEQMDWSLVADDILPIAGDSDRLMALPYFPQLKLPLDAQPAVNLPKQLPLDMVCELTLVSPDASPEIKILSPEQAVTVLLGHTAGTRLFDEKVLETHLTFCAQAAEVVPVYQLAYPRSKDALPKINRLLESLC